MVNKISRVIEYLYLVMAVFFAYETLTIWNEDRGQAYLFMAFVVIAIFMFFFRRKFRKRMEERGKNS